MTLLDELEDLLRRGKDEDAYELIKEGKGISSQILLNDGIFFGINAEYDLSISYLKLAANIAEDEAILAEIWNARTASYNNRGNAYSDLKQHEKAIEDYNKAIELNPKLAPAYANRGITRLLANVAIGGAIADFKGARALFEGADKERILGFIHWAEARNAMNYKNWADFRAKLAEARMVFEKIDDPLSRSLDAFIELSYLDEKLDGALKLPDAIEASKQIEAALKTLPTLEELIDPERTIFSARIASFVILQEFISGLMNFEESTELGLFETKFDELFRESEKVEEAFESVNFIEGKKSIVMLQDIISLVRHEVDNLRWAADKKQKVVDILEEYWSRLSPAIKAMNGVLSRETESTVLERQIEPIRATLEREF
jgi:tetratricopeptide (TPR) repeat protein